MSEEAKVLKKFREWIDISVRAIGDAIRKGDREEALNIYSDILTQRWHQAMVIEKNATGVGRVKGADPRKKAELEEYCRGMARKRLDILTGHEVAEAETKLKKVGWIEG